MKLNLLSTITATLVLTTTGVLSNSNGHQQRLEKRGGLHARKTAPSTAPAVKAATVVGGSNASIPDIAASAGEAVASFSAAELVPKPIEAAWLNPAAALTISYDGKPVELGSKQAVADLQARPIYSVGYSAEAPEGKTIFASGQKFTIMFVDASYVGDSKGGNNVTRHYLGRDYTINAQNGTLENGTPITKYGAPLPPAGEPAHRYMQLVWTQPASFKAPAVPAEGSGVESWDLASWVSSSGLGKIVAMNYLLVQTGNSNAANAATATPAATAIASASASVAAALASSSGSTGNTTSSGAPSPSAAGKSAATRNGKGAEAAWAVAGVAAVVGAFGVLAM